MNSAHPRPALLLLLCYEQFSSGRCIAKMNALSIASRQNRTLNFSEEGLSRNSKG
jgi:hypothetical protein